MLRDTLLIPFLASLLALVSADSDAVVLDAAFDRFVQQVCDELHVPGLSLAVVHQHSFESKGYGFAILPDVKATPDTLWFTGSTTKAFTAAAAALVVHDPVDHPDVSWSSPLSKLMPGYFALEDDYYTSHITLEDALSHRSGLPRHDLAYGWTNREGRKVDTIDVMLTMKHLPLTAEPRTRWQYCNIMYATVGQALSMLGGLHFGDVLQKLIWEPIGMTSTTTSTKEAEAARDQHGQKRLARGYFWNKDHHIPEAYVDLEAFAGAGATISSVNDYALWVQALLNAGSNDSSPISQAIYRDITKARTIMSDSLPGLLNQEIPPLYALGWFNVMIGSHKIITHGGDVPGFGAQVYFLPEEGLGFVSMANTAETGNQAGAWIFLEILKKLGKIPLAQDTFHLESLHECVGSYSKKPPVSSAKLSDGHVSSSPELPLPGKLLDYTGLFRHAAYGDFNVSLVEETFTRYGRRAGDLQEVILSSSANISLHVRPSSRVWPYEIGLKHESNTLFIAEIYWIHGRGDVGDECAQEKTTRLGSSEAICKQEVFFEPLLEVRAVFEYDLNGEVTKLGIELEPEMMVKDDRKWRDGMIWFEKQK